MSYCGIKDVVQTAGFYDYSISESLGTGDASKKVFSLNHDKVVEGTLKVYLDKVEQSSANYTVDYDKGEVIFSNAPGSNLVITATYKYIGVQLTSDDIQDCIDYSDSYIEEWTGKKFTPTQDTEYKEGRAQRIRSTDSVSSGQYFEETEEDKYLLMTDHYPIITVDSLQFLDDDGTVEDTLTENSDFHVWSDIGKIWLIAETIPVGKNKKKVKIVYTHGYATIPTIIKELSATISAIKASVITTGGTFDDPTSYSLGGLTVGIGEPYMNVRAAIERLEKRREELFQAVGRAFRTVVM